MFRFTRFRFTLFRFTLSDSHFHYGAKGGYFAFLQWISVHGCFGTLAAEFTDKCSYVAVNSNFLFQRTSLRALDSTIKYLKHANLAVESTKRSNPLQERCSGFQYSQQWTPPMAVLESTVGCIGLHCSVLVEFTVLVNSLSGIHCYIPVDFTVLFQYHLYISCLYFDYT